MGACKEQAVGHWDAQLWLASVTGWRAFGAGAGRGTRGCV